ncbi:MAG: chorismate synthase [Lachnospiraceae bacterium]|nr:chorismate synthase [Lachnospiraceae bacterium]
MAGSVFGDIFRVTTWGESHGPALGCVIDGCPAGLELSEDDIQPYMDRRKPGTSALTTQRSEADKIEILSGVFEGRTTGTPISLMIRNTSQHSTDYDELKDVYRPGHADYTFDAKYGFRDHRGGGRSSGRETAARVAAGAVAMKLLSKLDISIDAYTASIGIIKAEHNKELMDRLSNPVCMPDDHAAKEVLRFMEECRAAKDSAGGTAECVIKGVPAGLGEPVFDKLDALLGHAMFSIGAVKAVEIGDGISVTSRYGSENNDAMHMEDGRVVFDSNHAGGILGGISNGNDIFMRVHFKPTPSIFSTQNTVNKKGENVELAIKGRHDPVIVPRAIVVVECMSALVITDLLLKNMSSRLDHILKIYG